MMCNAIDLKPWMHGPFELIRHALNHYRAGEDEDRRFALIGFDNAIEVCIDAFLRLHPKLRDGFEISKNEKDKALRNYHTKLEFLDNHVQAKQINLTIPIEKILWYHQLRNQLYHSGNGMVPESIQVEGAKNAAFFVFQALYGVSLDPMLNEVSSTNITLTEYPIEPDETIQEHDDPIPIPLKQVKQILKKHKTTKYLKWITPLLGPAGIVLAPMINKKLLENFEFELLRLFLELRKSLEEICSLTDDENEKAMITFIDLWKNASKLYPQLQSSKGQMMNLILIRNSFVHGSATNIDSATEAFDLLNDLVDLIEQIRDLRPSC